MGKSKDLATGNSAAYVETAGDTMTGNLGIGGSPSVNLDVSSSGNTFALVKNTSSGSGLYIKADTDGDSEIQTAGGNNNIIFRASGVERMQIDGSGRITTPHQPCFLVNGNQGGWQTVSASATSTVAFHQEQFDQGNCFNNSTMRFVAPVAGKYLLHFSAYVRLETQDDDTNHAYTRIQKNGSNYAETFHVYGYQNNGDADQQTTITVIVDMAANDYAMCALSAASGSASFYQPGCQFMGYLIG